MERQAVSRICKRYCGTRLFVFVFSSFSFVFSSSNDFSLSLVCRLIRFRHLCTGSLELASLDRTCRIACRRFRNAHHHRFATREAKMKSHRWMMLLLLFAAGIIVGIAGSTAINAQLAASRARPIFSADLKGVPGQEILFSTTDWSPRQALPCLSTLTVTSSPISLKAS